jgi:hypothetical protein
MSRELTTTSARDKQKVFIVFSYGIWFEVISYGLIHYRASNVTDTAGNDDRPLPAQTRKATAVCDRLCLRLLALKPSTIEIRVENQNLRDAVNGPVIHRGGAPYGFGRRRIESAVSLLPVIADIRVNPGDVLFGIIKREQAAHLCAFFGDWNLQAFWKSSLNQISRHSKLLRFLSLSFSTRHEYTKAGSGVASAHTPILETMRAYFGL